MIEKIKYLSTFQNQFHRNKYKYYRQLSLGKTEMNKQIFKN